MAVTGIWRAWRFAGGTRLTANSVSARRADPVQRASIVAVGVAGEIQAIERVLTRADGCGEGSGRNVFQTDAQDALLLLVLFFVFSLAPYSAADLCSKPLWRDGRSQLMISTSSSQFVTSVPPNKPTACVFVSLIWRSFNGEIGIQTGIAQRDLIVVPFEIL